MENNDAQEQQLAHHYEQILKLLNLDIKTLDLEKTPMRVAKAMKELTKGYDEDAVDMLNNSKWTEKGNGVIVAKDIPFHSLCEHHLLPFYGKVHIAYFSNEEIVGLSKLVKVVDIFSHRLQLQERLTKNIANAILKSLNAKGVLVVIEAEHLCMQMRGEEKRSSKIITQKFVDGGDNPALEQTLLNYLNL